CAACNQSPSEFARTSGTPKLPMRHDLRYWIAGLITAAHNSQGPPSNAQPTRASINGQVLCATTRCPAAIFASDSFIRLLPSLPTAYRTSRTQPIFAAGGHCIEDTGFLPCNPIKASTTKGWSEKDFF
ncbi:hypothetical protein, partial [Azotobacter salinestris]